MRGVVAGTRGSDGIRWLGADARHPAIDRASPTDLAFLAMDTGPVPQQIAAILVLATGAFDPARAGELIDERIRAVPRLRQRLVRVPPGCGRAIWVDDAGFDIRRHVREVRCRRPGDERALLDTAAAVVTEPLPRERPLWSAVFVTGLADGGVALVFVAHHVLVDGIGGLAVLASLVDQPRHERETAFPVRAADSPVGTADFPVRAPSAGRLAIDALRARLGAAAHAVAAWRRLRDAMTAGGGFAPDRVTACSLVRRTGARRRLTVTRVDLAALHAAAHRDGGTVNDALLVAVAGALHRVLAARGESVDPIAVAVPVAARRGATASQLGNEVGPMVVPVPGAGTPALRIQQVAAAVRARRDSAAGPPPIAVLGSLFRAAAALGGYRWYMNHQRRMHTLVTNVHGPAQPVTFAGIPVTAVIPVAVGEAGNVTVSFVVLSYAGAMTITAVTDPDHFPEPAALADALDLELSRLVEGTATTTEFA